MIETDHGLFPEMPTGMKNRILKHLDFVDSIVSVIEVKMEDDLGKPLAYKVQYIFKGKKYQTSFMRKGYSRYYH